MSAIRYTNQRAIRSLPMSEALQRALIPALPAGITAEVFSGGQAAKGSGGPRTGSVRHDHGNAADIRFYDGDRQLDWANPDDLPLFQEIVRRGRANGLTGFGAGPGYMGAGTMHVGFGAPGVWGAGGKSANAPNWLREAYGEAPAGDGAVSGSGGQEMAYGGAGSDTLGTSYGGLGGLGGMQQPPPPEGAEGFLLSPAMGNVFGAISRIATGADPGEAFAAERDVATKRQLLDRQYADTANARRARKMALMSRGFTAEEAEAYSLDDTAATLAIDQKKEVLATARNNSTADSLEAKHPDIAAAIRSGTITGLDGAKEAWRRDREVAEAPAITSIFDENGNEQKGYMDPRTREWVNVGGAKSGKSGEGGMYGAPPSGFMYDPADPSRLQPIPGGPGEQISGENAGRIGIAQAFLDRLPSIRARVNDGGATGWIDATLGKAGLGEQGALAADIASGVDALQRMLSGAGTPEAESAQYAKRYAPTANDTVATLNSKLNRLEAELNSQMSVVLRGRGGKSGAAASSPAAPSAPAVTSGSSSGLGWSVK